MILSTAGILLFVLWALNTAFVVFQILRYSYDADAPLGDLSSPELMVNFVNNASPETVDMVQNITLTNPIICSGAWPCMLCSFII
jgi:hypothetical protein